MLVVSVFEGYFSDRKRGVDMNTNEKSGLIRQVSGNQEAFDYRQAQQNAQRRPDMNAMEHSAERALGMVLLAGVVAAVREQNRKKAEVVTMLARAGVMADNANDMEKARRPKEDVRAKRTEAWNLLHQAEKINREEGGPGVDGFDIEQRVFAVRRKLLDVKKVEAEVEQHLDGAMQQAVLGHETQMGNLIALATQRAELIGKEIPEECLSEIYIALDDSKKFGSRLNLSMPKLAVAG